MPVKVSPNTALIFTPLSGITNELFSSNSTPVIIADLPSVSGVTVKVTISPAFANCLSAVTVPPVIFGVISIA